MKAAQQRRTPKRGRNFRAQFALAFWSAPVLRRFGFSIRVLNSLREAVLSGEETQSLYFSAVALALARIFRARSTTISDVICFMQA